MKISTRLRLTSYYTFQLIDGSTQVKWTRVPDLVERRKVFLKRGWAYVPGREQSSIVFQEFEVHLQKTLEVCTIFKTKLILTDGTYS